MPPANPKQVKQLQQTKLQNQTFDVIQNNMQKFQAAKLKGTGKRGLPNLENAYATAKMKEAMPMGMEQGIKDYQARQAASAGMQRAIPAAALVAASSTPADVRKIAAQRVAEAKKPAPVGGNLNVTGGNNGGIGGKAPVSGGQSTSVRASTSTSTQQGGLGDFPVTQAGQPTDIVTNPLGENLMRRFGFAPEEPKPFVLTQDIYDKFVKARQANPNFVPTTAQDKAFYGAVNKEIMNDSSFINKEIARAQGLIQQAEAGGKDATAQKAYLKRLQDRKLVLETSPYLDKSSAGIASQQMGGSTDPLSELAQRDLAEYSRVADQQVADLTRQREADTNVLKQQLENIQKGLPAKSYQRMRQAFQNLANRGMLNSGLNLLSQNQETQAYNQEMADAYEKFADKLSTLQKGYGEKEAKIAEDRAKKGLPYFLKERQDMVKAAGTGAGSSQTGEQGLLREMQAFNQAVQGIKNLSELSGFMTTPEGVAKGTKGAPVMTAKERAQQAKNVGTDVKLRDARQKASQSFSLAQSKLASKNSMDRENMSIKVITLMNKLNDSAYKRSLAPDKATLDSLNKQMFALQGAKTPESRDAILNNVAPQVNNILKGMVDKANASNDPAALGYFSQYLK